MDVDDEGEGEAERDEKDERETNQVKVFLGLLKDGEGNRIEQEEVTFERFEARRLGELAAPWSPVRTELTRPE